MMKIDVLTLFPEMFQGPFDQSIVKKAQDREIMEIKIHDLRKWTEDKHRTVDNHPFGGGVGMVLMIKPIYEALKELKTKTSKVILLSPQGKVFNQKVAKNLSNEKHLIFVCGHYEGFDERIRKHLIDEEISIGDYVLTGGELPAMVIIDSITRLIPGVLKNNQATEIESFTKQLLEYPQYTRPADFKGWKVPEVLLSGDHKKIAQWQKEKEIEVTKKKRPDLLKKQFDI